MYWICEECGWENEYSDESQLSPCGCCGAPAPSKLNRGTTNHYRKAYLLLKNAEYGDSSAKREAVWSAIQYLKDHGISEAKAYSVISMQAEMLGWEKSIMPVPNGTTFIQRFLQWVQEIQWPQGLHTKKVHWKKISGCALGLLVLIFGIAFVKSLLAPPDLSEINRSQYWSTVDLDYSGIVAVTNAGTIVSSGKTFINSKDWEEINDIVDIAIGGGNIAALREDGTVFFDGVYFHTKENEAPEWSGVVDVDLGDWHAVAVKADGTVVAELTDAYNDDLDNSDYNYGQCDVSTWKNVISVSAGDNHTVGLQADGRVVATGNNEYGQCNVSDWTHIVAVGAGRDYTIGLKRDGTVVYTGGFRTLDLSGWKDITNITAGHFYPVGLKKDGTIVIASGSEDTVLEPHFGKNIQGIAAGSNTITWILGDGNLVGWNEENGEFDIPATEWCDLTELTTNNGVTVGLLEDGTVVTTNGIKVSEWENIQSVAAGRNHIVGLTFSGEVLAAGTNRNEQCNVDSWEDIVTIAVSDDHTVGLHSDGTVVAAGDNEWGQCDVDGIQSAASIFTGPEQTGIIRQNGTVMILGNNDHGQCDTQNWKNIVSASLHHAAAFGLTAGGTLVTTGHDDEMYDVSDWTNITDYAVGWYHTVGLREDGTVAAVGDNTYGQCDVEDWTNIVAIEAGFNYTVGLKADGTVVATGDNEYGQCDVQGWRNITAISASDDVWGHTVGLTSYGGIEATGHNGDGQCSVYPWPPIRLPEQR